MHDAHCGILALQQQGCGRAHNVAAADHTRLPPRDSNIAALQQLQAALSGPWSSLSMALCYTDRTGHAMQPYKTQEADE